MSYHNVRHYVQECALDNRNSHNAKELFNLRHSILYNIVERLLRGLKARYKILTYPRPFKIQSRVRVVIAVSTLYNIFSYFDKEESEPEDNIAIVEDDSCDMDKELERAYNISQAEKDAYACKKCNCN